MSISLISPHNLRLTRWVVHTCHQKSSSSRDLLGSCSVFHSLIVFTAFPPTDQVSGVNVFNVDRKNCFRRIDASENASFEWVVYNNNNPFLLKVNVIGIYSNGIRTVFGQNFNSINSGNFSTIKFTMVPNQDLITTDTTFYIIFNFTTKV